MQHRHKVRKNKPYPTLTHTVNIKARAHYHAGRTAAGTVPTETALKLLSDFAQSNGARRQGPASGGRTFSVYEDSRTD